MAKPLGKMAKLQEAEEEPVVTGEGRKAAEWGSSYTIILEAAVAGR